MKVHSSAIWVIICFSIGMTIYSTWCGIGLTYDSFDYLAAAKSFENDGSLLNRNGTFYKFHAPLFPVLLSFFGDNREFIWTIFSKFISLCTLFLISFSFIKLFQNKILFIIALALVGLNVGYQMIYNFLWTEPLFLFFLAAHNYLLIRFFEKKNRKDYFLLLCLAFVLGVSKNTGFFIILITSGMLLFIGGHAKLRKSFAYFIFGSLGFASWNIYLLLFKEGGRMFQNNAFLTAIDSNFINYTDVISQWFLPNFIPISIRIGLLVILIVLFIIFFLQKGISFPVKIFLIHFLAFLLIMIIAVKVDIDEIERLMAIVAPWFYISVMLAVDSQWKNIRPSFQVALVIVLILWTSYTITRSVSNSTQWHHENCVSVF